MGVRRDIATATADRNAYVQGCVALSQRMTGLTAVDVNNFLSPQVPNWDMRGVNVDLSWWDLFTLWHYVTMQLPTAGVRSNRAHGGPVFLPWHRLFMIRLEEELQRELGNPNFGLP